MSFCNPQSEICCRSVLCVQFFLLLFRAFSSATFYFSCASIFLLRFVTFCLLTSLCLFQPLKHDSGKKSTALWSQVANHPTIAFKIFFIFPQDLEKSVKSSSCWQKIMKKRAFLSNWFIYESPTRIKQWLECFVILVLCWSTGKIKKHHHC